MFVQVYGQDDLNGSFTLDFHPETIECQYNFYSKTFSADGSVPGVVCKWDVTTESVTMNVQLFLEDPNKPGSGQ